MPFRGVLAAVVTVALLALSAAAAGASSQSGSSKSGGFAKSSSKSGSSKSKSQSGASKPRQSSAKKGSSKSASHSTAGAAPGPALPSAPVHEDGSAADDVRIRGSYFPEATFAKLPCDPIEIPVGERRCWRCGDTWFEKLVYDGQPVYVEVFAPEGAHADELPKKDVQAIRGESRTYFAADDALYAPLDDERGGFVVVSTAPGFRVEELPDAARTGVPIVADGFTYYRYLGVYYREVSEDGHTYYVASESPF